jgi:hypothetical protein
MSHATIPLTEFARSIRLQAAFDTEYKKHGVLELNKKFTHGLRVYGCLASSRID